MTHTTPVAPAVKQQKEHCRRWNVDVHQINLRSSFLDFFVSFGRPGRAFKSPDTNHFLAATIMIEFKSVLYRSIALEPLYNFTFEFVVIG